MLNILYQKPNRENHTVVIEELENLTNQTRLVAAGAPVLNIGKIGAQPLPISPFRFN